MEALRVFPVEFAGARNLCGKFLIATPRPTQLIPRDTVSIFHDILSPERDLKPKI
jgi:hypothetical protein